MKYISCVEKLKQWIIDSEMGGILDKSDTFYPAYKQLCIVEDKLSESGEGNLQ